MSLKKIFSLLLCLLLCMGFASAQTDDSISSLPKKEQPAIWHELSAEDTVLTVTLPVKDADTSWRFQIGNENVIELITCEVLGDEEGDAADTAAWVGSFGSFRAHTGSTVIQFTRTDTDGASLETRLLTVSASENGVLTVDKAVEDSFYYLSEEGTSLYVSLPANASTGYSWSFCFSDDEILTCANEEYLEREGTENMVGAGGTWTAEFRGTFKKAGRVELTLNYARPWESVQPIESRTIRLFVNESNYIELLPDAPEENPFSTGSYGDEYFSLDLLRLPDGSYHAAIGIYRLTLQDDGEGFYENGALFITATDAAGNPMKWKITREANEFVAEVIDSKWSLLPTGERFTFE